MILLIIRLIQMCNPNSKFLYSDCCLFIFLDGSAFYLDDFLEKLTGFYRLMAGTVNGYPHFVARACRNPNNYGASCSYIWYSGYVFNSITTFRTCILSFYIVKLLWNFIFISSGLDGLLVLEDTLDRRKVSCTHKINHFVRPILVFGDI